jgi:hypothetical protein
VLDQSVLALKLEILLLSFLQVTLVLNLYLIHILLQAFKSSLNSLKISWCVVSLYARISNGLADVIDIVSYLLSHFLGVDGVMYALTLFLYGFFRLGVSVFFLTNLRAEAIIPKAVR